jgi:hypothetical protein
MSLTALILGAVAAVFPLEGEIDFSGLPPKGVVRYQFSLRLETVAGDKFEMPLIIVGVNGEPEDAQSAVFVGLKSKEWDVRESGLSLIVRGKGKSTLKKAEIVSTGIQPVFKWVPRNTKK